MTATLPRTMRALELRDHGASPEALVLVERPLPVPRRGQVLVRLHAAPINPNDLMFLEGTYEIRKALPVVPGLEGSGTVVASGGGLLAAPLVGRRVAFVAGEGDGTWAEYACADAMRCAPLKKDLDLDQGATLLTNPLTAWVLMATARAEGHRALAQTAAAGALGRMLVRLARRFRIPIVNVVRRPAQVDALRAEGAEHVLDSSAPGFDEELRSRCAALGVSLAWDAVAGEMTGRLLAALPRRACVRVYGRLSSAPVTLDPDAVIFGRKRIEGFTMYEWVEKTSLVKQLAALMNVQRRLTDDLKTEIRARVPLASHAEALALAQKGASEGKVLFTLA